MTITNPIIMKGLHAEERDVHDWHCHTLEKLSWAEERLYVVETHTLGGGDLHPYAEVIDAFTNQFEILRDIYILRDINDDETDQIIFNDIHAFRKELGSFIEIVVLDLGRNANGTRALSAAHSALATATTHWNFGWKYMVTKAEHKREYVWPWVLDYKHPIFYEITFPEEDYVLDYYLKAIIPLGDVHNYFDVGLRESLYLEIDSISRWTEEILQLMGQLQPIIQPVVDQEESALELLEDFEISMRNFINLKTAVGEDIRSDEDIASQIRNSIINYDNFLYARENLVHCA